MVSTPKEDQKTTTKSATNTTPKAAIDLIKDFEGLRLTAYYCPANIPTIGYGHTKTVTKADVKNGKTITKAEAERLLKSDLVTYENAVRKALTVAVNDNQFGALVSFAYNLGTAAMAGSTLLKRINSRAPLTQIESSWMQWNKARVNGVLQPLAGLTRRRAAEFALWSRK